jgi:nucleotide-binding universal stress UspA family protein
VTNVVLLKALASAEAAGVRCEGLSRTSDRPAEAIVEAATQHGADLIVMASRGVRGLRTLGEAPASDPQRQHHATPAPSHHLSHVPS